MSRSAIELLVWGKHPISEALGSDHARVHELFAVEKRHAETMDLARRKGVAVKTIDPHTLSKKLGTDKHQDVGARVSLDVWDSFSEWFESRKSKASLLAVAIDGIEDPQNVGSLFRSAHFFGAEVLVITRDRVAPLTGAVARASAGALFSLPVVRAANLARELETCGELAVLRIGLDADGPAVLGSISIPGDVILVVGSEEEGLRELTRKRCDHLARLTEKGGRDSLNAAVAGAVALHEIGKAR